MDFISCIFGLGGKFSNKKTTSDLSPECIKIIKLKEEIQILLQGDKYIPKSEYAEVIPTYKDTVQNFMV